MIEPYLSGNDFLADVRRFASEQNGFRIWWLGQSGFLVQYRGSHLLFDPYLSDSLTKKYAGTDKPHVRLTRLVVSPGELDFIDVATSSHNHTDHLDAATLLPLKQANPDLRLIIPEANRNFVARRLGCDTSWPIGVCDGDEVDVGTFTIHGVPAAHEDLATDAEGRHHFMGYIVCFGPHKIYHSGDTLLFDGMVDRLEPFRVDVALLPINGRNATRRVAGNMSGLEAARLALDIAAKMAIPCHYDMFAFNTAPPDDFVRESEQIGQVYYVLQCGERWDSPDSISGPGGSKSRPPNGTLQ